MNYYRYWGKASGDKEEMKYHLLVYHSLDVAAVGVELCKANFLSKQFCEVLNIQSEVFYDVVGFLCGAHDVGKFSEGFQNVRPDLYKILNGKRSSAGYQEKHGSLGYRFLREYMPTFLKINKDILLDYFDSWFSASAGHHGRPPENQMNPYPVSRQFSSQGIEDAQMFLNDIRELFPNAESFFKTSSGYRETVFQKLSWDLAGLMVLADWIGSNADWFSYQAGEIDLRNYYETIAIPQAKKVFQKNRILPKQPARQSSTKALFPKISLPTPLQQVTEEFSFVPGPKLFIIEEVTGAGKTEAALMLTHRLMAAGEIESVYFGLPTMATANAMYKRVESMYRQLYETGSEPSLILAHSASRQYSAMEQIKNTEQNYSDNEESSGQAAKGWLFDNRKKALLADVGVGTIDQALLAVLPARHQSLRLLGLYRKVLIVDEVHAYDSYMNGLLCNLLKFHAAHGGSVILLSATLPRKLRMDFIKAFADGLNYNFFGDISNDYPLLTSIGKDGFVEKPISSPGYLHREVTIKPVYEKKDILDLIMFAVQNGKSICWVRNTVYDALDAYDWVMKQLGDGVVTIFHARFALGDRLVIEKNILNDFGPDSSSVNRSGKVVIATQVVEQSLDLDFDFMVSDLAPIDLIIQRAGRLCRHPRDGKGDRVDGGDRRGIPEMAVYMPSSDGEIKSDWYSATFPKAEKIYEHHGRLWLTAKWLAKNKRFRAPDDLRPIIEYVYGEDNEKQIPEVLQKQETRAEGNDRGKASLAQYHKLKLENGYMPDMLQWADDEKAPTRVGELTTTVRLAVWKNNTLVPYFENDWPLSQVTVYRSLIADEDDMDKKEIETARKMMPDGGKYCVVIPLKENGNCWEGFANDVQNQKVKVLYDLRRGLRVQRQGEANEFDL